MTVVRCFDMARLLRWPSGADSIALRISGQRWNPALAILFACLFAPGLNAADLRAATVGPHAVPSSAAPDGPGAPAERGLGAYLEGTLLQMDGRHEQAIAAFRRAAGPDTAEVAPQTAMARSWLELGRADSALHSADLALRRNPSSAEAYRLAGISLSRLGRGREALTAFDRALELDPEDPATRMNLLALCDALRLHAKALEVIDGAPEDLRGTTPMRARRARLLLQLGRNGEALGELVRVVRSEREFPEAEALLLLSLSRLPPTGEETAPVESLLAARPDLHRIRIGLARLLLGGDDWREAERHLSVLARDHAADPTVMKVSGMFLLRAGRPEEAEDRFRDALAAAPNDPEPYRWLCRAATMRGQPREALGIATRLLARSPGDREGILCQAFALGALDRVDEALSALEALRRDDPADREVELLAAALLADQERFREAVAVLRELSRARPGDRAVAFELGSAWERAGEVDSALAVFDRLLAENPDDALVLNYSGYMCIDRGIRLEESLDRVRRAVEIDPESGAYVDSYGWGLHKLGRHEEAEAQLRRAISLTPREPEIHRHLGAVLEARGQPEAAREAYLRARDLRPEDPVTRELLEALERRAAGQPAP